ncbi:MAG: DUF4168 domain-containing protein [Alphaproteobacteria bacterium]|nr:DUF4168 domain-containing protein [Alphaproteobacteria bacterium]
MRLSTELFAIVALTAASLLTLSAADAQTPSPTSPAPTASISDQKLDAAAAAIDQVTTIRQSYQQKLSTAAPADQQRIAGEATDQMKKAVTDQGLSVEEYNSILQVAQNNPGVRQKLLQRLHQTAQ